MARTLTNTTLLETMNLKVVLEPSDEGGYTVYVPSLPGCISEGESIDEALTNIQEAIELYLEPLEEDISKVSVFGGTDKGGKRRELY